MLETTIDQTTLESLNVSGNPVGRSLISKALECHFYLGADWKAEAKKSHQ